MIRRLASLHWLQLGAVRLLQRYYQDAMTSCRPSRRTPLPSFGGTSAFTRCVRSPADECAAEAWSWSPGISGRALAEETTGPRKFLGNPDCPFAHVQSTPAGLLAPDRFLYSAAAWPSVFQQRRLPRKVFRRSIAWLSDSLRAPCAAGSASQDGLPRHHARLASGRWSGATGRAFHPQGSYERFQSCFLTSHPLFPKLCLAQ